MSETPEQHAARMKAAMDEADRIIAASRQEAAERAAAATGATFGGSIVGGDQHVVSGNAVVHGNVKP